MKSGLTFSPRPIQIWQPRRDNGEPCFVRPEPLPLGDHYARRRVIPAAGDGRFRICLLGESAAAGYLYAPALTPARILGEQLNEVAGGDAYEVIDFARTNERLLPMIETLERALQLGPDLVVVFAGNNSNLLETPEVSQYFPGNEARLAYAEALRADGVLGPIDLARRLLRERVAKGLVRIAEIGTAAEVPVIVVIPEVNLADWQTRQPVSWLSGDGVRQWHQARERASASLRNRDYERALDLAWRMVDLDRSSCSTSCRLLAEAYRGLGDERRAQVACLGEIDSAQYSTLGFLAAPQITGDVREVLLKGARRFGLTAVDLRAVFAEHSGSALPGRRYFLDYCHLTREGMKVAMAAVSAEILRYRGRSADRQEWPELADRLPDPEIAAAADATAKLGAAIHTAHRCLPVSDGRPLLEHWCREAIRASPGVVDAMLDYVAARVARVPAVLTAAQLASLRSPYPLQYQHGWRYEHLDAATLETFESVLEEIAPQRAAEITRLIEGTAPSTANELELARPFYAWEPLARFYPEVMELRDVTRSAICRSPWPHSVFALPGRAGRAVELDVVLRLPRRDGDERSRRRPVRILLNGRRLRTVPATGRWNRFKVRLDGRRLRRGLNRISFDWPLPEPGEPSGLAAAIERLERGIEADVHPVFGEIASLRAR